MLAVWHTTGSPNALRRLQPGAAAAAANLAVLGTATADQQLPVLRAWLRQLRWLRIHWPDGACQFTWKEPGNSTIIPVANLGAEETVVSFLIAAATRNLALSTAEPKEKIKLLIASSAMFDSVPGDPSSPVSIPRLRSLAKETRAFAQEVIYHQAEGLNESLRAKLAIAVATTYQEAIAICDSSGGNLKCQQKAFECAANLHMGRALLANSDSQGFGCAVARLRAATVAAAESTAIRRKSPKLVIHNFIWQQQIFEEATLLAQQEEKENRLVYREIVPSALLAIAPQCPLPPAPEGDLLLPEGDIPDFHCDPEIERLFQPAMERALAMLAVVESSVAATLTEVDAFIFNTKAQLVLSRGGTVPNVIWARIEALQMEGGLERLESTLQTVEDMAQQCSSLASRLEARLLTSTLLRRTPDVEERGQLYARYRAKLETALDANRVVRRALIPVARHRGLLSLSREALDGAIARMAPAVLQDSPQKQEVRQAVAVLLAETVELKATLDAAKQSIVDNAKATQKKLQAEWFMRGKQPEVPEAIPFHAESVKAQEVKVARCLEGVRKVWDLLPLEERSPEMSPPIQLLAEIDEAVAILVVARNDLAAGKNFFEKIKQYLQSLLDGFR